MSTKTIEQFFTGKTLVIPGYQRDYAWTTRNVDDLFNDVEEALEAGGSHYLGTFILSQKDKSAPVHVVDGQQRLTTLTMLLDVLIDAVEDQNIKLHYSNTFIAHPVTGPKFRMLGANEEFFRQLLNDQNPVEDTDGQERLLKAHSWIRQRVLALMQKGGQARIHEWLQCLSQLEVLEFIEPDEGKAIRMFQSVNDRGVPLAKMDIVKSLLVYYSNRYLGGELDKSVAGSFGAAFRSFSRIKRLAREKGYQIRHIDRDSFREDDVLRYHYFSFDGSDFNVIAGADYNATSETVLEVFLKPALSQLRGDPEKLKAFITRYSEDLARFFEGLESLIEATRKDKATYLLFVSQDLAATLYPLTIRLHLNGWLTQAGGGQRSLQELIELIDLRVFKLRGTNPQADIAWITRGLPNLSIEEVVAKLKEFCRRFMPDALMASRLVDEDLFRNPGLVRMLLEIDEQVRLALKLPLLDIPELAALNQIGLTVEHILPQEPSFDIKAYGFTDDDEYLHHKHRFGNLMLLEGPLNSACNNRTVEEKMSAPNLYRSSSLSSVSALVAGQTGYQMSDLNTRSAALAVQIAAKWPIQ
ncbi:MAG: DUF262 domain-containing HNH endonuclease family protein [Burkholderiaceae bacterium]|nr:DUF262 domain-containing HNH endonuclease family protein [Burkholderiaceae bacterium]